MTSLPGDAPKAGLRTRIMLPMILLAALALAASGAIVAAIQYREIGIEMDEQLMRSAEELRNLADGGLDPKTGEPFAGPKELLSTFLSRTKVSDTESMVGFVEDRVSLVALDVALRPENDPELVEALRPLAIGDEVIVTTVRTQQRDYRALVAPVIYPTSHGAFVRVFDVAGQYSQLRTTMLIYGVTAFLMTGLAAAVAWPLIGRLLHPIHELRVAADSIDEGDLTSRVPVRGKDELAGLTSTINRMLDRVQRSVEGQQRLLDDVGHELRTPITVVRGHLELVDPADPDDVTQTRDLAIDELDRMGGLVNDLLVLAKAGQTDFVTPRWSDLASLTDQTFEKARSLGERAWVLDSVAATEAWLDPARITQAWLQLAANAVTYSDRGTRIAIGSRVHRGEAQLWVSDQGVGISADEIDRVRERFARGRQVSQSHGVGLGLSIVESIVAAHGGWLDIASSRGEGSTFTLVVPIAPVIEPPTEESES